VRVVAEAIEAPQLLRETLRARAEGFLAAGTLPSDHPCTHDIVSRAEGYLSLLHALSFRAAGLASGASSGHLKLCKLLIETGASVERSEALHEAVSAYYSSV
jgi:hypothetical protein